MKRAVSIPVLLAVAGVATVLLMRRPRPASPNFLLVTIDTLRADRLGCYGYPRGTSPAIDRLAAEGTAFRTAIVPRGQTWPTLASILTSQYPVTHGVRRNGLRLDRDAVTVARVLGERGWVCAAFLSSSGPAAWPGFSVMRSLRDRDGTVAREAAAWIRANASRPFFLWVHLFAPHHPYRPPPALARRFGAGPGAPSCGSLEWIRWWNGRPGLPEGELRRALALYDGEVRRVDRSVARILGALREAGLEDRTLVILTADHGEELRDHGDYFSHSASVYDDVLRVPLVFRWPGRIAGGRWREEVVEAIDLAPTMLETARLARPPGFEGRSLAGVLLRGEPDARGRAAFSELEDRIVTVRTEECRYVHNPTGFRFPLAGTDAFYPIERAELYVHRTDPGERRNVAAERPEAAARLREAVERWQEAHGWRERPLRAGGREATEAIRSELEALGYLTDTGS